MSDEGLTIEERAGAQGWVPKEEFRGDPDVWVDAETFVQRGEEINPILKERIAELERRLVGQERDMGEFLEYHKQTESRAYEQARQDILEEQAKAIEGGDGARFKELEEQKNNLDQKQMQFANQPQRSPEAEKFQEENPWYGIDQEMTVFADATAINLHKQGYSGKALAQKAQELMKRAYPEKFGGNGNNQMQFKTPASPVEGGGRLQRKGGRDKKTFDNLPPEAKSQYEKFARRFGKDKDGKPKFTKEQYAKNYQW